MHISIHGVTFCLVKVGFRLTDGPSDSLLLYGLHIVPIFHPYSVNNIYRFNLFTGCNLYDCAYISVTVSPPQSRIDCTKVSIKDKTSFQRPKGQFPCLYDSPVSSSLTIHQGTHLRSYRIRTRKSRIH